MKTFDTKKQFKCSVLVYHNSCVTSIDHVGQNDLKTVVFTLSFLFYRVGAPAHQSGEFVTKISYEIDIAFFGCKRQTFLSSCIILP